MTMIRNASLQCWFIISLTVYFMQKTDQYNNANRIINLDNYTCQSLLNNWISFFKNHLRQTVTITVRCPPSLVHRLFLPLAEERELHKGLAWERVARLRERVPAVCHSVTSCRTFRMNEQTFFVL